MELQQVRDVRAGGRAAASGVGAIIRVLMTKNATNIRYSCTQPNTQSMGSCELKGPHKIYIRYGKQTENGWVLETTSNETARVLLTCDTTCVKSTLMKFNQVPRLFDATKNGTDDDD